MHLHLYPIIVGTMCFHRLLSTNWGLAAMAPSRPQSDLVTGFLHRLIAGAEVVLERILPTVSALMPDRAPLIICLLNGCNALALRIPYGVSRATRRRDFECDRADRLHA